MSQKIKTSVEIDGSLSASQIANATTDTDKFLVSDGGTIKYRTGAELATDLGISSGTTSKVQHQVKAGVAINKGQAVYVTGADGTNMIVGLASNVAESSSSKTMGLLNATVSANGFADVIAEGLLSGLDTSTATVGDPVWLGTSGNLIYGLANKPYAPNHLVFIGIVTRVNANNGEIFVKVQNGFELNEIHDVDLKSTLPSNNDILTYEGGSVNLWKNKSISAVLGYTPYNASNPAGYISTYTETDTLASVTSRGALTNTNIAISAGTLNHVTLADRFNLVGGSNFHITNNAYYDSGFKYKFADLATKLALQADGMLSYQTAVTGTIGSGVTFDTRFSVDSAGNLLSTGSMLSPIFYDSNNTAYYIDPASTSNLNALNIGNAKLRWGGNTTPTLGLPFSGSPNAFWIDVNDGDTGGLMVDNEGVTVYGAGDNGYVFRVIDEDVYQATTNLAASTTFQVSQGQNGGGFIKGNFDISGTLTASGYNKTNWDTAYGWGNHASAGYALSGHTHDLGRYSLRAPALIDSVTASNFRTQLFGSSTSGYNISTARFNATPGLLSGLNNYGTMMAWSGSDTHGFLAIDYAGPAAIIGGGNADNINWTKRLAFLDDTVPNNRTITINGTSYDLSANRSWTVTASETDTLATVVARGATANSAISVRNGYNIIKSDGVTAGGQLYYDSSINQFYLWNSIGSGYFSIYTNSAERLNISSGGSVTANVDMRSPIFYDSNDTTFYVDPNSASKLRNLYVGNSGNSWVDSGGWGTQFQLSNGPHSIMRIYARDEGIETGMFSHVGGQSKAGSLSNHNFSIVRNFADRMTFYDTYTYSNVYMESAGSMRAPIFYDSNDTSYYGDFNSTTRQYQAISFGDSSRYSAINTTINGAGAGDKLILYGGVSNYDARLLVGADYDMLFKSQGNSAGRGSFKFYSGQNCNLAMTIDGSQYTSLTGGLSVAGNSSWFGGYGPGSGPGLAFENQNTFARIVFWGLDFYDWNHGTQMVIDNGYVSANNSFRSPIFYDSNNTAYYVDPASSSSLRGLTVVDTIYGDITGTAGSLAGRAADRYIWGDGANGRSKGMSDGNANTSDQSNSSGFYFGTNVTGMPGSDWWNWLTVAGDSWSGSDGYRWQMAGSFWSNDWRLRRQTSGGWNGWVSILHSDNYNSFSPTLTGGNASGTWGINITGSAGSAGSANIATQLSTNYAGGQQLNPQVYFNDGIGLKVAMTAKVGYWSDTVWINGYAGGDVPWMCALHTQRNSSPRMYISSQQHISSSYGTAYEFITDYNKGEYVLTLSTDQDVTGIKYFLTNNGGYVGSLSSAKLQAYSTGNNSAYMSFHKSGHYAVNMGLDADNVMRIGGWSAASNRWQLDMSGNMTVAGDVTAYSDARVKENIETISKALDKVLSLRGVTYNRIDSEDKSQKIGVIAQEVQNVIPQVVHEQADGMLGVSYGNITALLIEAIKEQQTQIEELKQLVNKLINK